MDNPYIYVISGAVLLILIIIHVLMHSKHPVRSALFSLLPGVIALMCVNLTAFWTNVSVPVSPLSLSISAVLGIPGVTALLVIRNIL